MGLLGQYYDAAKRALVSVGMLLLVFAAFRNTFAQYMDRFWYSSHSFWSYFWGTFYSLSGENDFVMVTLTTWLFSLGCYVLFNAVFTYVDLTGRPTWFIKYKIQEKVNTPPIGRDKYMKTVKLTALNVVLITPLFNVVTYPLVAWRGMPCGYELPSFWTAICHLAAFAIVEEFGFYYSHRLLHHRRLYKHIHKIHHEWTAPVSLVSLYCHPVEFILSNVSPLFLGPLIMGSHLSLLWVWYTIALFNTVHVHSGYHLPFMPSSEAHDFHHYSFNNMFGALGILDRFHGTDVEFREHIACKRNFVLKSFQTAKELVPDKAK
jgi:methylsterol monooxygenase